ncbi:MAG: hypothetical protein JNN30_04065 [Rhodanobacteraceae bacterium]|nr:hypothetical protein [Rhodanobacteraceae bacterium]
MDFGVMRISGWVQKLLCGYFVSAPQPPSIQALAVHGAASKLKSACGSDVKFDLKVDSFPAKDELTQIRNFSTAIKDGALAYCSDAGSKKAVCGITTIEISYSGSVSVRFAGGKVAVTTDSSSYPSWDMMMQEVDK